MEGHRTALGGRRREALDPIRASRDRVGKVPKLSTTPSHVLNATASFLLHHLRFSGSFAASDFSQSVSIAFTRVPSRPPFCPTRSGTSGGMRSCKLRSRFLNTRLPSRVARRLSTHLRQTR